MYILLGDIGNTKTKICILNNKLNIIKKITFDTFKFKNKIFLKEQINILIKKYKISKKVFFSSVVPEIFIKVKNNFKKSHNISCIEIKELNFNKLIKVNVNKNQIGSDRIANAIGSYYNYKCNCIVIDFGTATTFDVIINGTYKGGIIAPGVSLSLETLTNKASLIPVVNLKKIKKIVGKNTKNAIRAGYFWGYAGLIDNILKLIKKETKTSFKIILTGGYSYLFKDSIKTKVFIDNDITIKGLVQIFLNQKRLIKNV